MHQHAICTGTVSEAVGTALAALGWEVDLCSDAAAALGRVTGRARYDLLLVGDGSAGAKGVEVVRRARALPHRRRTPVVMLAAGEWETAAWRASTPSSGSRAGWARWSGASGGC